MNKTQIKEALERKLALRLLEIDKRADEIIKKFDEQYISETVGKELEQFNKASKALKNSVELENFVLALTKLSNLVNNDRYIKSPDYTYENAFRFIRNARDSAIDYPLDIRTTNYKGLPESMKVYMEADVLESNTKAEYNKLFAFLKATTAQKFMERMEEIGFKIDIQVEVLTKQELPAPIFNIDLLR